MGKPCVILAVIMLSLYFFPPENFVSGAILTNSITKTKSEVETGAVDTGDMDYDYAFLYQPSFAFGGFPRRLSKSGGRHKRLMKRLKRYVSGDNPVKKIPAGCCSCGDHYCCDGMCHGK